MNQWSGKIGFFETKEVEKDGVGTGVWKPQLTEKRYFGIIQRDFRKTENSGSVNDNINISNTISILSDQFLNENLINIKYIEFKGHKFKVQNIEVQDPRIVVSLGGLYNEGET